MKTFIFKYNFANNSFAEDKLCKYFINNSLRLYLTSFTFAKFIKLKIYIFLNIFYNMFALKSFTTLL